MKQFPYMKACAVLKNDVFCRGMWYHQRFADMKHSIMNATNDEYEMFEMFKKGLKRKPYEAWVDSLITSEEFKQYVDDKLQPRNMEAFINDIAGFGNIDLEQLTDNVNIQTREGKIAALRFKETINDQTNIVNIFRQ